MQPIVSFVKRQALLLFFLLAFALSWLPWLLYMAGMFSSPIIPLGVSVAAIIVAAVAGGRTELKELLARLVRWHVGAQWYLVAFLLPAVIVGATVYLTRFFGVAVDAQLGPWYGIFTVVLFQTFFPLVGAMGEELGWRGFALPRLQASRSALSASLILGVITAAWHLPLFVTGIWGQPVPHILFIIAFSVVIAWLFNKTNGSVLLAILFHGAFNGILEFLYPAIGLANLDLLWWMLAGVTSVAAVGVFLFSGKELGRTRSLPPQVTLVEGVGV